MLQRCELQPETLTVLATQHQTDNLINLTNLIIGDKTEIKQACADASQLRTFGT